MSYALITGSSKGIGRALAFELAKRKFNLLLTARSEKLLKELATELIAKYGVEVKYLELDLSSASAITTISTFISEHHLQLTVLVNNAGYGLWGRFETLNLRQQIGMLRLNNESIIALTYQLLPFLRGQPQSYILNIASTAAFQAVPYMSVYAASRSFLVSFSRGLSEELKGTGVSVTCLSATNPGHVINYYPPGQAATKTLSSSAEKLAFRAVNALFDKEIEYKPGLFSRINACASYFLPRGFFGVLETGLTRNIF